MGLPFLIYICVCLYIYSVRAELRKRIDWLLIKLYYHELLYDLFSYYMLCYVYNYSINCEWTELLAVDAILCRGRNCSLVQFTSANYYAIRGGFYCGFFFLLFIFFLFLKSLVPALQYLSYYFSRTKVFWLFSPVRNSCWESQDYTSVKTKP